MTYHLRYLICILFGFNVYLIVAPISIHAGSDASQVLIPSGEYDLGSYFCEEEQSNADWCNDELPRKVQLTKFVIGKYEVTNADYRECFVAGVCEPAVMHEDRPEDFNKSRQPAVFINWTDAQTYCAWREGKLPTEEQWEAAAKGPRLGGAHFRQPYNTGSPENVGKFEPNSNGLYDMMGNVYEWTLDWYGEGTEIDKVVRGGSWNSPGHYLRTSDRVKKDPELRYSDVGFRCVKTEP